MHTPHCALILIGGFGTRLRPLTLSKPKPLINFINKPILMHQIDALKTTKISKIILATNKLDTNLQTILNKKYPNLVFFSVENKPLGTAGPLKLAYNMLKFPLIVLNADVSCDFPFQKLLDFHLQKKFKATILATKTLTPEKYGVIVHENSVITRFVEKPSEYVGNLINAGIYVLDECVLDIVEDDTYTSIENEVFPRLVAEKKVGVVELNGYWMDIGQPKDYLKGVELFIRNRFGSTLDGIEDIVEDNFVYVDNECYKDECFEKCRSILKNNSGPAIDFHKMYDEDGSKRVLSKLTQYDFENTVIRNSVIHKSAEIGSNCFIGDFVVIGKNVKIGNNVTLKYCTIFDNCNIEGNTFISESIVGWNCAVKTGAKIINYCVLGENVIVEANTVVNDKSVLPDTVLSCENSDR